MLLNELDSAPPRPLLDPLWVSSLISGTKSPPRAVEGHLHALGGVGEGLNLIRK